MKYRKKPVVIDAEQWDGSVDGYRRIILWAWNTGGARNMAMKDGALKIWTLEGVHTVSPGDFVIRGVGGEYYPCKPDIFGMTYEVA